MTNLRIGFISTRFAGTDGVSLEAAKWVEVLEQDGHQCFWYAGRCDRDREVSYCIPEAHFDHPENLWINDRIWGRQTRDRHVTRRIREMASYLKDSLYRFIEQFQIDLLIPQNVLTIPMHVPLGVAVTQLVAETSIPTVAHHHDFYWERKRFSINAVQDYLDMAFPSFHACMQHVVINKAAQQDLSFRKGLSSTLIPNVFDFDNDPPPVDTYAQDVREELGIGKDQIFVLQPTRIVPRKGIEHAIRLVHRLQDGDKGKYVLVISHAAGDEGTEYKDMLVGLAADHDVDLRIVDHRVGEERQLNSRGQKVYTLWDLYPHCDFVTYTSIYEGFGNALLETIYFRKPLVTNRYDVYVRDLESLGLDIPVFDGFVTQETVDACRELIEDPERAQQAVDHNYAIATEHFSYTVLRRKLRYLISKALVESY